MIINLKNIIDSTIGGTQNSDKPISSGALYNTINIPDTPSKWDTITNITTDPPTRLFAQQLWYNRLTGMVELNIITPPHKIAANSWGHVAYLVGSPDENTDTSNWNMSDNVKDYVAFAAVYAQGQDLVSSGKPYTIKLDTDGRIYAYNPYSSQFDGRIKCYMSYRCKLNRIAPSESET